MARTLTTDAPRELAQGSSLKGKCKNISSCAKMLFSQGFGPTASTYDQVYCKETGLNCTDQTMIRRAESVTNTTNNNIAESSTSTSHKPIAQPNENIYTKDTESTSNNSIANVSFTANINPKSKASFITTTNNSNNIASFITNNNSTSKSSFITTTNNLKANASFTNNLRNLCSNNHDNHSLNALNESSSSNFCCENHDNRSLNALSKSRSGSSAAQPYTGIKPLRLPSREQVTHSTASNRSVNFTYAVASSQSDRSLLRKNNRPRRSSIGPTIYESLNLGGKQRKTLLQKLNIDSFDSYAYPTIGPKGKPYKTKTKTVSVGGYADRHQHNSVLDFVQKSKQLYDGLAVPLVTPKIESLVDSSIYQTSRPLDRDLTSLRQWHQSRTMLSSSATSHMDASRKLKFVVSSDKSGIVARSSLTLPTSQSVSLYNVHNDPEPDSNLKVKITPGISQASLLEISMSSMFANFTANLVPAHSLTEKMIKEVPAEHIRQTYETKTVGFPPNQGMDRAPFAEDTPQVFRSGRVPTLRRSPALVKRTDTSQDNYVSWSTSTLAAGGSRAVLANSQSQTGPRKNTSQLSAVPASSLRKVVPRMDSVRIDSQNLGSPRFYHWAPFNQQKADTVHCWVTKRAQGLLQPHLFRKTPGSKLSKSSGAKGSYHYDLDPVISRVKSEKVIATPNKTVQKRRTIESASSGQSYYGVR